MYFHLKSFLSLNSHLWPFAEIIVQLHFSLPSRSSHIPLPALIQTHSLFFSLIIIACTYICVYIYIPVYYVLGYVCIYAYLYTYMCECGLRADHLAPNNHLVCPSLRKTTSAHRFTWLPIVLCIGLSTNIFNKSGVIHDNSVIIKVFWRFFFIIF